MPIGRNSFIQMTKLSNVKGRITYISSHAKQENLYAVYETTERKFWRELAKCNQEEFVKSGTDGKCIEARELIIALPESFTEYQPDRLLQLFTNHFKQNYGTECIAALHHNKRKTNYHIHLIFAERKLLDEPIIKIASRNMFYDENGKHVRTKKEILGEDGEIREGCSIVKKGEVYEKKLFTAKDERFKCNSFLDEVKHSYTDLINIYVQDEKQKLQVFERGSVYLATKKIGKNNPKAQEIEADNQKRREWNRAVDMALISGVPEPKIMEVKRKEITEPIRESIARRGNRPRLFSRVVTVAVEALEFLIASVLFKKPREVPKQTEQTETEHPKHVAENSTAAVKTTKEEKAEKEDKTEQEEKEESVPVSGSGVVQMQRESRRKERVKENARNLAKASARLAGTDGSKRTEDILQEEVQSTGTLAGNAQAMEIKGNADKESAQEDVQEEIPKEDTIRELPKDEMIRQILREFMA